MKKTLAAALFSTLTFTGTPSLSHEIGDRMPYLDEIEIVNPSDWVMNRRKVGISVLSEITINDNYKPLIVFYVLCSGKILDEPYVIVDIYGKVGYIDAEFDGYINKVFHFDSLWGEFRVNSPVCPLEI